MTCHDSTVLLLFVFKLQPIYSNSNVIIAYCNYQFLSKCISKTTMKERDQTHYKVICFNPT